MKPCRSLFVAGLTWLEHSLADGTKGRGFAHGTRGTGGSTTDAVSVEKQRFARIVSTAQKPYYSMGKLGPLEDARLTVFCGAGGTLCRCVHAQPRG